MRVPDPDLLPCGCLITYAVIDGVKTATVSRCRRECPVASEVIELLSDQGDKPVTFKVR